MTTLSDAESNAKPQLVRGIGLGSATALNMIDMIGVGPFITIPLIVTVMGGPQAMLGWIVGAVLVAADGYGDVGCGIGGGAGETRPLDAAAGLGSVSGAAKPLALAWRDVVRRRAANAGDCARACSESGFDPDG